MNASDLPAALTRGDIPYFTQEIDGRWHARPPRFAALVAGSFYPLHRGHLGLANAAVLRVTGPVAFEMSITNVDKPTLDEAELRRRIGQFEWLASIVVTRAATFAEKTMFFPNTVFVVGRDTAERIIDPRYRSDLAAIRAAKCRFLVAGRIDSAGEFRTIEGDLFEPIPADEFREDISSTQLRNAECRMPISE